MFARNFIGSQCFCLAVTPYAEGVRCGCRPPCRKAKGLAQQTTRRRTKPQYPARQTAASYAAQGRTATRGRLPRPPTAYLSRFRVPCAVSRCSSTTMGPRDCRLFVLCERLWSVSEGRRRPRRRRKRARCVKGSAGRPSCVASSVQSVTALAVGMHGIQLGVRWLNTSSDR